jgi:hypothetical protein
MADAYDFWAERIAPNDDAAIDRFWGRFVEIAPALDGTFRGTADPVDVAGSMTLALGDLAERVTSWEFGPAETGHFLALSPELCHEKRPLIRALLNRAPELDGWEFGDARRPHEQLDQVAELVASRMNKTLTLTGASSRAGSHRRIDLVGNGSGKDVDYQAGLVFSVIFGEAIERDWLGEISFGRPNGGVLSKLIGKARSSKPPESWLGSFKEETQNLLDQLMEGRPEAAISAPLGAGTEVTLYECEPRASDDPRSDTITYQTAHTDLAAARFAGVRISSVRFSRHREILLGLRIERTPEQPFGQVSNRSDLAERIDSALRASGAGGVYGEGHGTGHVYIDFATGDIPMATAIVERVLVQGEVSGPAAFLFDEAGLEQRVLPFQPSRNAH